MNFIGEQGPELYFHNPKCQCGHMWAIHDLSAKKVRTACSHADGPKNTPCGCKAYVEGDT